MLDLTKSMFKCYTCQNFALILNKMFIKPSVKYSLHIDALIGLLTIALIKPNFIAYKLCVYKIFENLAKYTSFVNWNLIAVSIDPNDVNKLFSQIIHELQMLNLRVWCAKSNTNRNTGSFKICITFTLIEFQNVNSIILFN